jgi:hypothetical protein
MGVSARRAPRIRRGVATGEVREAGWLMQTTIRNMASKKIIVLSDI